MSDEKDNLEPEQPPESPIEENSSTEGGEAVSDSLDSSDFAPVRVDTDEDENANSGSSTATGEMVDREERKLLKAKKKKEEQEKAALLKKKPKKKPAADNSTASNLKGGVLGTKQKQKRKQQIQVGGALIASCLIYMIYGWLFHVPQARKTYGICMVYLENNVRFPLHLRPVILNDFGANVRIWYKYMDAFGAQRMENIRCYFKRDPETKRVMIDRILIDRREEPSDKIASFNRVLPIVIQNLPPLDRPSFGDDKRLNFSVNTAKVRGGGRL